MNSQYFSQTEFDASFHKLLHYADGRQIAAEIGKTDSWVSKMFNPNHPAASPLFRAAAILVAWIVRSPVQGRLAWKLFKSFVERAVAQAEKSPEAEIEQRLEIAQAALDEVKQMVHGKPDIKWVSQKLVREYREARV